MNANDSALKDVPTGERSDQDQFGQTASVLIKWIDDTCSTTICGNLLNVTRRGIKLSIPSFIPLDNVVSLRIRVREIHLDLLASEEICWTRPSDNSTWVLGCAFDPALPRGSLKKFSGKSSDHPSQPRNSGVSLQTSAAWYSLKTNVSVRLEEFSAGGFCLASAQPANAGDGVELFIETSTTTKVCIPAAMQWQLKAEDHYLIACAFNCEDDFHTVRGIAQATREHDNAGRVKQFWQAHLRRPSLTWFVPGSLALVVVFSAYTLKLRSSIQQGAPQAATNVQTAMPQMIGNRHAAQKPPKRYSHDTFTEDQLRNARANQLRQQEEALDTKRDQLDEARAAWQREREKQDAELEQHNQKLHVEAQRLAHERSLLDKERQLWTRQLSEQAAVLEAQRKQLQMAEEAWRRERKQQEVEVEQNRSEPPEKPSPQSAPEPPDQPAEGNPRPASTSEYSPDDARMWTDVTEKFQIDAVFIDLEGSNVRLRKTGGTQISIPLQMLSDNDQSVVQQLSDTH